MKKLILLLSMMIWVNCSLAQEGKTPGGDKLPADAGQVPSLVMEKFNQEFPGISGNWSRDGDNFKVEFTDPQSHLGHVIVYDRNGDVIRRESELDKPSNPGAINEYYKKNYPGEELKTWSVTEKNGSITYYTSRNSEVVKFDREGRVISSLNPPAATPEKPSKKKH